MTPEERRGINLMVKVAANPRKYMTSEQRAELDRHLAQIRRSKIKGAEAASRMRF